MHKSVFFLLISMLLTTTLPAQTTIQRDKEIEQMVSAVSADSLRSYINTLVAFGTRNTLSTQTNTTRGIGAARNWVLSRFNSFATQSNGRLSALIDTITLQPDKKRIDTVTVLGNVVATLKGVDTADHRIFVISGHLDNMRTNVMDRINDAPGADDDGSGVAAVLECARIMSRMQFPATIMFVAFSGEEQGLLGSTFMATKARKENINIAALLNNDIIGSTNSSEIGINNNTAIRVFSEGLPAFELEKKVKMIRQFGLENDGSSRQLARYIKETGERYVDNITVVMVYRSDRFLRGGDHIPFLENGYPAVRLTEMNENFTHQHQDVRTENGIRYGDLPEWIDYEYLRKNTAVNLASLANLAKASGMPDSLTLKVKQLENTTSLSWKAPKTGTVKGYYVLLRETTSAFWQRKIYTTETSVTLPYSKDNYFFAVQSVSGEGNESLALMPTVGR